jgi:hypothetical protein
MGDTDSVRNHGTEFRDHLPLQRGISGKSPELEVCPVNHSEGRGVIPFTWIGCIEILPVQPAEKNQSHRDGDTFVHFQCAVCECLPF